MATDRPPLRFGLSVTPTAATYPQIVAQVLAAERVGLDLVGIQDHPYQRRFLDTFALIADLLARTQRLRMFPDVASLPMRPPAMLAKAAASLDAMSGGRFELGLGAGGFWDAVAGMGGVRRDGAGERIGALEEAIGIIRGALDVGPERRVVRSDGPYHVIPGYPAGPPPAHRVEIWVGAMAPRTLDLIGRLADGWIPGNGIDRVEEFGALTARLDAAARAAGRDPGAIRRVVNVPGALDGRDDGSVDRLVELAAEHRVDAFIVWPPDTDVLRVERLGGEVAPAVHEALSRQRGGNPG